MSVGQVLFVVLFLGVGGLFSLLGVAWAASTRRFLRRAARAAGVVVGHERRVSEDEEGASTLFYPVVEFDDKAGRRRRVTLGVGSNPAGFAEGARVTVLFDPEAPADARLCSFAHLWL